MFGLTPMMERMLYGLAKYKYLTVSHIMALGISKGKEKSRKYFSDMKKQGLVDRQIHVSVSENLKKKGKLQRHRQEYLWYLTQKGVQFLLAHSELEEEEIRYSKRPLQRLKNDYFHRVSTISSCISYNRWVDELDPPESKCMVYFDSEKTSSAKAHTETRLSLADGKHYSPDALFGFRDEAGRSQVFCLEVYNNGKVGYVEKQLKKLFGILESSRKIEEKFGYDTVPRILVTLDSEKFLESVIKRVKNNPAFHVEGIEELILFKCDTDVRESFVEGRKNIEGQTKNLTYTWTI